MGGLFGTFLVDLSLFRFTLQENENEKENKENTKKRTSWRGRLEPRSWSTEFCAREKKTEMLYTLAFTPAFGIQGVNASLYFNIFMSQNFPVV